MLRNMEGPFTNYRKWVKQLDNTNCLIVALSLVNNANHILFIFTSSGSLNTVKGPSYSGFGVNSKSSISSETISLFVMRKPCGEKYTKYITNHVTY